jgi:hypothetical protein
MNNAATNDTRLMVMAVSERFLSGGHRIVRAALQVDLATTNIDRT